MNRSGQAPRQGRLWGLVLRLFLMALVGGPAALAGPGLPEALAQRVSGQDKGASFNPHTQFTITKIEPRAAQEEVRVYFSAPVPLDLLRSGLRVLPRVKLDWDRSSVSEDGVLTLKGNFRYGSGHYLTLPDRLVVAGRRYVPTVTTFQMPDRPPRLEFVEHKRVIERDSRQLLHVKVLNVKNVILEGVRVPPLLLAQALAAEQANADPAQTLETLKQAEAELKALLRGKAAYEPFSVSPLAFKQMFPAGGEKNRVLAASLPLSFRPAKEAGAFEFIRVKDGEGGSPAATESRLFRVTDLGLTYKLSTKGLLLWVTSLKGGTPAPGVQVLALTRDLEIFPLGQTDKDGLLTIAAQDREGISLKQLGKFKAVTRRLEPGQITHLLAGLKGDVSYLEVQPEGNIKPKNVWQVSREEQPQNLKGQVFTERGVYRPGEKVFFKGTVREYREGDIAPPKTGKAVFEIFNPREERVFAKEMELSDFGTAFGEMQTEAFWAVGTYTLTMRYGPEARISEQPVKKSGSPEDEEGGDEAAKAKPAYEATTTFQVQEFRPPRHFTEISFERFQRELKDYVNREAKPAEFVRIIITGGYYAGGPVKHGQVRWRIQQAPTSYQVQGFEGFTFGYDTGDKGELMESGQAILDEAGRAVVEFPLDRHILAGRQGLNLTATVLDFDGRAASTSKVFQAEPDFRVGISRHPERFKVGDSQELKLVVLDPQGKKIPQGALRAEILENSYTYVAKRNEQGDLYWEDESIWRRVFAGDLTLKDGQAAFHFDCGMGGRYLLAFTYTDDKGRSFTSATLVRVEWEYIPAEKRDRPYVPLNLWADKPAYKPGETAQLQVTPQTPVSYYLITMERDGILHTQVMPGRKGPLTIPLAITADYGPNVYVSVLGLSPRGDFPVLPGRYDTEAPAFVWGTLNLPVLKEPEKLEVKISPTVPELRSQPGAKVTLDLSVTTPQGQGVQAEVALAVVDEAVLALTGYKTPTLDQLTRFDLPLAVFTGELRVSLIHQTPFYPARVEPLTGGGGLSAEMVSKLRRRFEAVAYYNPKLLTDAQGKAQVSFTLPDNITQFRIFAVVVDRGSRFASAERHLVSTKDFYLEPGVPGFFTWGDTFTFEVNAMNATAAAGEVKLAARAEGPLALTVPEPAAQLGAKDSKKLKVTGEAKAPGAVKAHFQGEFQGKKDEVELSFRVNSGLVRERASLLGSFTGSGEVRIPWPAYLGKTPQVPPEEIQAVLTVSGSPFVRFARPIQYLLTYPYGCVEQTSSGILGLAAVRSLVQKKLITGVELAQVDEYLKRGIGRLLNLQTSRGGFSYWPGQSYPHNWGTVYAAAALTMAKRQGFEVPENSFQRVIRFLQDRAYDRQISGSEKAFIAYLLALNQALSAELYRGVVRDYPRLNREGKVLVLLAGQQAGLRGAGELKYYLKPLLEGKDQSKEEMVEEDFDARFRGTALTLMAARAILPDDPGTQQAALTLLGGLGREGIWTSTSDTGWALLALGEFYQHASFPQEAGEVTVSQGGAAPIQLTLDPGGSRSLALNVQALLSQPVVRFQGRGGHTWLYQVDLLYPRLDLKTQGEARGFKVSKTIRNTDGSDTIRVGDLVKVSIQVELPRGQRYVVLDDPLPAGLVAINSAFRTEQPLPEGEEEQDRFEYVLEGGGLRFRPHHFEIRQDRVLAFRDVVYPGSYRFEYYARAVCEGNFVVPSTKAEAMYSPAVQGFTAQSRLVVKGR